MQKYTCPVCYSHKIRKLHYKYVECMVCSCYYLRLMPSLSFLQQAIQRYGKTFSQEIPNKKLKVVLEKRLNDLAPVIPRNGTILDVGSGMGQFILYAKGQGYRVVAMDKAIPCITNLKNEGIQTYTSLRNMPDNSFDAVVLFDVIEHIKNPRTFLKTIRKKIKKSGVLMITTPNVHGISSRVIPSLLTYTNNRYSEHVVLYTNNALTQLIRLEGFKVISQTTDIFLPWCYTKNTLVKKLINKIVYLMFFPLLSLLYNFGLGDNIQIIAKVSNK